MLRIHEIKLGLEEDISTIPYHIKKKLGLKRLEILEWTLIKESVDARDKGDIRRVYTVDFTAGSADGKILEAAGRRKVKVSPAPDMEYRFVADATECKTGGSEGDEGGDRGGGSPGAYSQPAGRILLDGPPVVAGFGPCGMFAGLLLAQMGYRPIILERGKDIDRRVEDVEAFWNGGVLNAESNVQFGEGGAGAFSDGKLTTQIKDKRVRKALSELVAAGGGEDLLYRQKPHVGTDVLRVVVKNIRREILRLGGAVEFESRLTGLILEEEARGRAEERRDCGCPGLAAVEINGGPEKGGRLVKTKALVLALGHSARDTLRILCRQGLRMEQKPFSMGARIEHPQAMINQAQYGKDYNGRALPPAEYKLSWRCRDGRGVYTFCMCPGGRVIASASVEGGVVTNGMSYRSRDLENANSALLVDVRTEDFESSHPLAGLEFQEKYERLAFQAGGGGYKAPAQRVGDFLACRPSAILEFKHGMASGTGAGQGNGEELAQ